MYHLALQVLAIFTSSKPGEPEEHVFILSVSKIKVNAISKVCQPLATNPLSLFSMLFLGRDEAIDNPIPSRMKSIPFLIEFFSQFQSYNPHKNLKNT